MLGPSFPGHLFQPSSPGKTVNLLYAVLHPFLSCLIPPANLLVIVAVYQLMRKQPGTSYVYILNLATADLLVGAMCIAEAPDDILDGDFDRSKSSCLLRMTPCNSSILTLLLISLDRYLAVTLPLSYSSLLKKTPMVLSLLVPWTLSFLFGHLPLILPSLQRGNRVGYCGILYAAKSEYLYAICFGIFAPSLLVLVWPAGLGGQHRLRAAHVAPARLRPGGAPPRPPAPLQDAADRAHRPRRLQPLLGPYLAGGTVQAACSSCKLAGPLKDALFLLGETNSLISPLIYALYSKDIRSHLAKLLRCRMKGQVKPLASNIRTVGSWGRGWPEVTGS